MILFTTATHADPPPAPSEPPSAAGAPQAGRTSYHWPRTYMSNTGGTLTVYQPQVDSWKDSEKIRFRAAFALTPAGSKTTEYGVLAAQADTLVNHDTRTVIITNLDMAVRFPNMPEDKAAPLKAKVKDALPKLNQIDISLDQVIACMHEKSEVPRVALNYSPPPIYFSDSPAIMVIYLGEPSFKPIAGTQLEFAVNTNWPVIRDPATNSFYLLNNNSWLVSNDPLKGDWKPAGKLPDQFAQIPAGGDWNEIKQHIPGQPAQSAPRVIAVTKPSELIVTDGEPKYTAIPGTKLMYVNNPTTPVFWDTSTNHFYFLASGRWFRAEKITGPWSAASKDLPADFAKIPSDSPVAFVLSSVPNTQEAQDAILLASIPHKATIKSGPAKLEVTYSGDPQFVPIEGTKMTYATNTGYEVIGAADQYYCCYDGVWFVSPASTGPWIVCRSVPDVIYTIPASSPVYNVTYCRVYSSTPDTVVVGYTSGYSGEYVAATGVLMFGAGMLTGAMLANDCTYPSYYSYGCAGYYNYAAGGFYRGGASYYGPYGGAGYRAGYNPATGTYYRGGYAAGPGGAHWGEQAYNPWTNTYAQHTGGTNGYKSWGNSYVQQGNKWAQAGHESTARGGVGYAQNSQGQWAEGAHSNVTNTSAAKTSGGDYYASHDGNVYKNTGNGWQKYNGDGNWSSTAKQPTAQQASYREESSMGEHAAQSTDWDTARSNWEGGKSMSGRSWSEGAEEASLDRDAAARDAGTRSAASSFEDRGAMERGGFGGGRFGGGGFRGRR